jgi:3-deoxy-D-manno-octulosonate 8-phosphate phosphatase (KDO 8-P phosphatase)
VSAHVELFAFDIDGTLTDGTTTWLGPEVGWTQRYSVRDGEALLRLAKAGVHVVPLSRNKTECARQRMSSLSLSTRWVGVDDKIVAFSEILAHYRVALEQCAFVGDGAEDAPLLEQVGHPFSVKDAHPLAIRAARYVTRALAGSHAIEEIVFTLLAEQLIRGIRADAARPG